MWVALGTTEPPLCSCGSSTRRDASSWVLRGCGSHGMLKHPQNRQYLAQGSLLPLGNVSRPLPSPALVA